MLKTPSYYDIEYIHKRASDKKGVTVCRDEIIVNNTKYTFLKKIGEGKNGIVYQFEISEEKSTPYLPKYLVVKLYKKMVSWSREYEFIKKMSFIYYSQLIVNHDATLIFPIIIFDYVEGKPVDELEIKSAAQFLSLCIEIVNAVKKCHTEGFVHGDITQTNLLGMISYHPDMKIIVNTIDYGASSYTNSPCDGYCKKYPSYTQNTFLKKFPHIAPERFYDHCAYYSQDVFSIGYIISSLMGNFSHLTFPQNLLTIIDKCMSADSSKRPSTDGIIAGLQMLLTLQKEIPREPLQLQHIPIINGRECLFFPQQPLIPKSSELSNVKQNSMFRQELESGICFRGR